MKLDDDGDLLLNEDPDEDEYGSTFHTEEEYEAWEREWYPEWSDMSTQGYSVTVYSPVL